jgi:hypothetical protein
MDTSISSRQFFEMVLTGELGKIDIDNYLQSVTDNFNPRKLKLLLTDIELFLNCEREDKEAEYSVEDVLEEVNRLEKLGKEVPKQTLPKFVDKRGVTIFEGCTWIDKERLLFPFHFFCIYQLIGTIKHHIDQKEVNNTSQFVSIETDGGKDIPHTFEDLFYNPINAEPCLNILSELNPPVIDAKYNYIGKAKGVFPLWIKVLKSHRPQPLIKHFKDTVYKDLLNQKINGLNLTKDASEFRKGYKRLENDNVELDIKALLSQYSQNGKLGK